MVDDLYVHIGHPKTGTGSLQQTFRASADVLAEGGVLYDARPRNHHPIAHVAHGGTRRSRRTDRVAGRFRRLLRTSRAPVALLSTEALIRLSDDEAAAFVAGLARHAGRVTVVVYVRHPVSAASSFAQEGVRVGRPLEEIVAGPRVLPVQSLLERWERAANGRIVVRPFARPLLTGGDVVDDMLALMGRPALASRLRRVSMNEPLSALGIALLDRAHRLGRLPREATRIFERIEGPRYVLPEEALCQVRRRAAPELAFLEERFGIVLPEPEEAPTPPPGLDEATLGSIAAVLRKAALHAHGLDRSPIGRLMEQTSPFTRPEDTVRHPLAPTLRRLGITGILAASGRQDAKRARRRGRRPPHGLPQGRGR